MLHIAPLPAGLFVQREVRGGERRALAARAAEGRGLLRGRPAVHAARPAHGCVQRAEVRERVSVGRTQLVKHCIFTLTFIENKSRAAPPPGGGPPFPNAA